VARDYSRVAFALGSPDWAPRHANPRTVVYELPDAYQPHVTGLFDDLIGRQVLAKDGLGRAVWGPKAQGIDAYRDACAWTELTARDQRLRAVS
jgi:hypothetical protein